ncbi:MULTISPECIES: ABC transporter ATP-binding protein [Clostridium]|uniref:Putative HMP/thiamine import ATP-binding protein YkoD n=1 Tax=Clostridium colicanis DSM 13634 TaxID=1121305 RepID=A0A151ARX7_9CLOT|nr:MULTISPECIES: energy-coupling factor transporter ATPase [Clostridium]KYH30333.1 putative HMP/thiamine import ATP-binding protein YkoD [Clostridium colicanis DSM 13634]MBE6044445.1 ABC transporter ATP-binding protein [Clostridium thermopalmarium]
MKYIEIKDLNYYYPDTKEKALDNINISVESGDIVLVLGESGSGKSTLGKCISGAIPNFYGGNISGSIIIGGKPLNDMEHNERSREITMVFQDPERQLLMNKVHREVAFGLENTGVEEKKIKRRVFEAMQFSNILSLANRNIDTLSGGQKQKVAVASAISYLPKCIILDEPTSQLDPTSSEEIVSLVKKINEEMGVTIIVIEQRVEKWFNAADKIFIMKQGRKVFYGNKMDMYREKNEYITSFLPSYLKLCKSLNISEVPQNLKEARKRLKSFKYERKVSKEHNLNEVIKINIKKLYYSYEKEEALRGINLSVRDGDFISILGPNGAGKSTFLKSIMGLIKYKGSIEIDKKEVKKQALKDLAKTVGYVSQNPNDYISKDTVYEEVKFTLDNYRIIDEGIIEETLRTLDLYKIKDKNPRDISGGERQRLAIASILVLKPKILLLDEPTRGIDNKIKGSLGKALRKLNEGGTTILMVTHDIEFAAEYGSSFLLMFNGEIVAQGSKEEVLSEGIYYTTTINKLIRDKNNNIFTLKDIMNFTEI